MTPASPDWWRGYIGAPYRWRGMDRESGFDCWGLVVHAYAHVFGREIDDFGDRYPDDREALAARAELIADVRAGWREVEWEEGAVALFEIAGEPLHVGIATASPGKVLHCYSRGGGADLVDLNSSRKWKRRLVALYLPA